MNSQLIIDNEQLKGGYKETKVGVIPEDWEVRKLEEVIIHLKSGLSRKLNDKDIGIPCIRSANIVNSKLDLKDIKYWYLEDPQGANIEEYILKDGDLLVNFINSLAQIGKACIYKDMGRKAIYTTNIFSIRTDSSVVNSNFLYNFMLTENYRSQVLGITNPAVNQASFTSKDFKKIKIPIPPLKEQKKIATILSSVDEHIEEVDGMIEDLKELKKGLMQKLLTGQYSFDNSQFTMHNSQLKDEDIRLVKTKEFKKTKLGMIPKHWEVKKLGELVNIEYGGSLPNGKRMGGQYPVYGSNGIVGFHNEKLAEGPTIILGRKGSIDKVTYVSKDCFPIDTTYYLINRVNIDLKWLASLLSIQNLIRLNTATGVPSLNRNDLNYMNIQVPPFEEQEKIASILSSVDERIESYEEQKEDIEELKKGLMQQLLTGKKRVLNN